MTEDLQVEAMNRHCEQCAREMSRGAFDVLFASPCTEFRVTAIARCVEMPSLLYLQEPTASFMRLRPSRPGRPTNVHRGGGVRLRTCARQ